MLSDTQLLKLYKDEKFPGSFSGGKTFQQFLKTELNEDISLKRIYKLLQSQPFVIYQMKQIKKFPRRMYDVKSYMELVQCDLGQMYEKNGFNFFLVIIDVFTNKIFCYLLKSKSTKDVEKAFEQFYSSVPEPPSQVSTDQGIYKNALFILDADYQVLNPTFFFQAKSSLVSNNILKRKKVFSPTSMAPTSQILPNTQFI